MTKNKTWLVSLFPFIFHTLSVFISCDYQHAIPFTECDNYVFDNYDSEYETTWVKVGSDLNQISVSYEFKKKSSVQESD